VTFIAGDRNDQLKWGLKSSAWSFNLCSLLVCLFYLKMHCLNSDGTGDLSLLRYKPDFVTSLFIINELYCTCILMKENFKPKQHFYYSKLTWYNEDNCWTNKLFTCTVALHESGTRKTLLGPWLSNTEVYLYHFISTQNHTFSIQIFW
jgi:hypothetical protein